MRKKTPNQLYALHGNQVIARGKTEKELVEIMENDAVGDIDPQDLIQVVSYVKTLVFDYKKTFEQTEDSP